MYHPDKVNKQMFGSDYFLTIEEISKFLNSIHNKMKWDLCRS